MALTPSIITQGDLAWANCNAAHLLGSASAYRVLRRLHATKRELERCKRDRAIAAATGSRTHVHDAKIEMLERVVDESEKHRAFIFRECSATFAMRAKAFEESMEARDRVFSRDASGVKV